ncbi:MAG: DUF2905 domain-containing protein [Leptospirales bacterium]|nr:DUF2905 domain-containing protein [Leptospirales bacterium]
MNNHIGKILVILGIILVILGLIFTYSEKITALSEKIPALKLFGRLPGDIRIEKENFSFYFPVVTCIILSIIITFILKIISKFR